MTKRLYIFGALAALMLAGCSKEPAETPEIEPDSRTALSFTYERPAVVATYSAVAASDLEKAIYDLSVFAFAEDGAFVAALAAGADYTETLDGSTATLEVERAFLAAHAGETLTFFFVGNNAASKGGPHATAASVAAMTAAEFENSLCAPLPVSGGKSAAIEDLRFYNYPPAMYEGLLMTAKSEVQIVGRRVEPITLTRRTARFDVRNEFKDTYELSEIYIADTPVNGPLFGTAHAAAPAALRSYARMYGPDKGEYENNGYTGWFYLYPCTLGMGDTEITILVTRLADDATSYATLKGSTEVEANKRYTLVFNPVEMTFILDGGAGDYEDGN